MKVKYFLIGFLSSIILTLTINSFAEELFNVVRVEYPIIVDGKELASELPALNYNGSTYIPLRKFSEATGATINWGSGKISITSKVKEVIKEKIVQVTPKPVLPIAAIDFENGDKYNGTLIDNMKSGYGRYVWKNGDIYIGEWLSDYKSGKGMYRFSSGDIYVGDFKNNKFEGFGTIIFKNGDAKTGTWENDSITKIFFDAKTQTQDLAKTTYTEGFVNYLVQYSAAVDNSDMEIIEVVKELPDDKLLVKNKYGTEEILEAKGYLSSLSFTEGSYYVGEISGYSAKIIDRNGEMKEFYVD